MAKETILLGGIVKDEVAKINANFTELYNDMPTKTSDLTNDSNFATLEQVQSAVGAVNVPTKTSELTNDSNYQTAVQVTATVNSAVGAIDIPTKTSELTNDSNFVSETQVNSIVNGAVANIDVPTKLSELTNDANYLKTTDTAFINKVDKVAGKDLSTNDYTDADAAKVANLGKIDFTTANFTVSGNYQVATIAATGKYPVKVMRQNGSKYEEVIAQTSVEGNNIVITANEAFAGYVVTI